MRAGGWGLNRLRKNAALPQSCPHRDYVIADESLSNSSELAGVFSDLTPISGLCGSA
jgi:hypothetical protein